MTSKLKALYTHLAHCSRW